jgi:hypothetical protein
MSLLTSSGGQQRGSLMPPERGKWRSRRGAWIAVTAGVILLVVVIVAVASHGQQSEPHALPSSPIITVPADLVPTEAPLGDGLGDVTVNVPQLYWNWRFGFSFEYPQRYELSGPKTTSLGGTSTTGVKRVVSLIVSDAAYAEAHGGGGSWMLIEIPDPVPTWARIGQMTKSQVLTALPALRSVLEQEFRARAKASGMSIRRIKWSTFLLHGTPCIEVSARHHAKGVLQMAWVVSRKCLLMVAAATEARPLKEQARLLAKMMHSVDLSWEPLLSAQ